MRPDSDSGPRSPAPPTSAVQAIGAQLLRIGLAFTLAAAGAALATTAAAWISPRQSPEKFARLAHIVLFVTLFLITRRRTDESWMRAAALDRPRLHARKVAAGFVAGAASLALLLLAEVAAGWWKPRAEPDPALTALLRAAWYVPAGLFLATWEEGLFRGVLYGDVARVAGVRAAVVVTSLLFGISHLLGPARGVRLAWSDSWIGPRATWANVAGLVTRLDGEWPLFVGLTLVGVVLALLRARAGTAWLGVGVHAGWYFVQQMDGRFLSFALAAGDPVRIWSGGPDYADGVLGWCALLLTFVVAQRLIRKPASSSAPSEAAS
jgi:uncharacterized protein